MEHLSSQEILDDIDVGRAAENAAAAGAAAATPAAGPFAPAPGYVGTACATSLPHRFLDSLPFSAAPAPGYVGSCRGVAAPAPSYVVAAPAPSPLTAAHAPGPYRMGAPIRHIQMVSTPITSFAHIPLDLVLIHQPRLNILRRLRRLFEVPPSTVRRVPPSSTRMTALPLRVLPKPLPSVRSSLSAWWHSWLLIRQTRQLSSTRLRSPTWLQSLRKLGVSS